MTEVDLAGIDVVEYLASKGVQTYKAAGDEVTAHCFFCHSASNQRGKGKLYINAVEALYSCKVCGESGNFRTLIKHFGDTVKHGEDAPRANRRAILEMATTVGEQMLMANEAQVEYLLNERGLSAETIIEARLGYVPPKWSLAGCLAGVSRKEAQEVGLLTAQGYEFYENRLLIPYLSRGAVVQLRGREPGAKYFTAAGDSARLFNSDELDGAQEVIVTEGEYDALVLRQHLRASDDSRLRKIAVVGVPGAQSLPPNIETYFENARRVFLGFDPDTAGKLGAERLAQKLGSKARVMELPDDLPKCDWTEFFTRRGGTADDVAGMLARHRGGRLISVATAGQKWREQRATQTGMQLGYQGIDATIRPGLLPGQVMVVLANTGAGKTIFALNVAYNNLGRRHLLVSLEMTAEECYERLRRIYLFHHPKATDVEIDRAFANLLICDENRLTGRQVEDLLDEYEEEIGAPAQFMTMDYLGYFARASSGNGHYEKTSEAIMTCKEIAKRRNLIIFTPHQVSRSGQDGRPLKASDARDSGVVEETADFLFTLWRPDDGTVAVGTEPNNRVCVSIEKSRHGGKGRTFNLIFGELSLVIVDSAGPEVRRVENENYLAKRGWDWNKVLEEHRRPQQQVLALNVRPAVPLPKKQEVPIGH
jgi:archaellum biogenesis ATPase FlaH